MTGILTVIPWLPLPLLDIAGRVQPAIRASAAAAVLPISHRACAADDMNAGCSFQRTAPAGHRVIGQNAGDTGKRAFNG